MAVQARAGHGERTDAEPRKCPWALSALGISYSFFRLTLNSAVALLVMRPTSGGPTWHWRRAST